MMAQPVLHPPQPPRNRVEVQSAFWSYYGDNQFKELRLIMKTKCLTSDLWKLSQEWKRLMKQIKKVSWVKAALNYLR